MRIYHQFLRSSLSAASLIGVFSFGIVCDGEVKSFTPQGEDSKVSGAEVQKIYRRMLGIKDYTLDLHSRAQILEGIAKGIADDEWAPFESSGADPAQGKQIGSSIVYPAKDGSIVYRMSLRCDNAYTPGSSLHLAVSKFEISDDGVLGEVRYASSGFAQKLGKNIDEEVGNLIQLVGLDGERLGFQLISSFNSKGSAPAYSAPRIGLPRIYLGGASLKRTAINLEMTVVKELFLYYETTFLRDDLLTRLLKDALLGHLYFTTENGLQRVAPNYDAGPIFKACLISPED